MPLIEVGPRVKEYEPYAFWVLGTPLIGYGAKDTNPIDKKLAKAWWYMMQRCYNPEHQDYGAYGAKGISVCKGWHQVANYVAGVKLLHGWESKLKDWTCELDKDYYSSNQYSPETCVWLSQDENLTYRGRPVKVTCFGVETIYLSMAKAGRATGVLQNSISTWLSVRLSKPQA